MRIAFAGTPEFARTALEALHGAGHDVALVLTQPDRPSGRGLKLLPSAVKAYATAASLPLAQPQGLRLDGRHAADASATAEALRAARPDAIVVAAYGLILPPWLLGLPRHGCLNLHASLLPRWRGAAPVQRAIEAGDAETGVTLMQMDAGLDTGAMLAVRRTPIDGGDTAATLTARLAAIGAALAVEALATLDAGGVLVATAQPDAGVAYAAKIAKAESAIDWREPAERIERRLRAFDPFPGARSQLDGETVTCWRGSVRAAVAGTPGEIVAIEAAAIIVACGTGALALTELQRSGGRRLAAADFLRGQSSLRVGRRFDAMSAGEG